MQIQIQQGQILLRCLNKIVLAQYTIHTYDCKYLITDEIPYRIKVMQTLNAYFLKGGGDLPDPEPF
jgi:hypothetical protein